MGKVFDTKRTRIPELRDGDRMNSTEFMRRYKATPEGFRAELINGVVHVNRWVETDFTGEQRLMPPISGGGSGHGGPQMSLSVWVGHYWVATPGTEAASPSTVFLADEDSTSEPDAMLRILPESGGQCWLDEQGYYNGPPELIVEIAKTTAARDLGSKLEMYQRNGVQEYLVWRVEARVIDWFALHRGEYRSLVPDGGLHKSRVFPGLWLDSTALLAGDMATVLAVLQQGIAAPEHTKFVEKLRKKAKKK
jgi:Uma2 family endonuclease